MSSAQQTSCPHCHATFSVNEEQLRSADGKVRCGACLRVFDALSGDTGFVAPSVSEKDNPAPLSGLSVRPMENADLVAPATPAPLGLKLLLLTLVVLLGAQFARHGFDQVDRDDQVLQVTRLVVRAHPEQPQALRLDAILHNTSDQAAPYPALFLYLDNRYGERRGQRLFLPAEYLPEQLAEPDHLPAHTRLQVSLSIKDPGQGAVNYGLALQSVPALEN